ncbi:tetratricopeptide repeat-containing sensor histidine kinase [Elizabethkingia miricola]|uniref:tetratricopeptide repeat-containing sensor histidine kinase n=3 Tax=Elizabethkingia miricola TaxID=172045 RepID=UPI00111CC699|nr:ATP-binding protein [Elizabethkingia miricola]NHQ65095.1 ATP-binding protein [Elizabethkingia miricola]QHQ87802.1 ATP-binding protein [Elizabethkingia miricola]UIO95311.1 ATP-binding protein [Elizabethkingia miricola]WER12107.1 ATP-binding protein [Elizabethkingia miricola]WGL72284.1 ATP-binding protein [Elizabethkingia miricola]
MKNFTILFLFLIISCTNTKENVKVNREYYDKAYGFLETSQKDSAFVYFNKAKEIFIQNKSSYSLAGSCLVNMGIIQYESGDFYGAQETALSAIKYLNEKNKEDFFDISSNYNNLGIINRNLENYNKAIEFYNLAMKFSLENTNKQVYLNNIAYAYGAQKKYREALKIYNLIFKKDNKNNKEYSRALTNLAKTKWLQNADYNPVSELKKALNIRLQEKDLWGQNSSYAHLADYYTQKKPDSALIYATKMYDVAKTLKSPDDQVEALQKLIILENPEKSKQYFLTYQKLNDSLQTARSKAKNQFALIRYETEKNKADFQKAQADNVKKQNQILKQYAGLGILGLVLIGGGVWYRRRKKILQQEKELEVKKTELRYSKKVHDKVANKVYRVMSEVENAPEMEKEELLDKLENIYEISRDISYDHEPTDEKHLVEMLESYSSQDDVQLVKVGIQEIGWDTFNKDTQSEVFNVLQELMTNMKKHSKATRVVIRMNRINEEITIRYTDNGVGCDKLSPKNGIKNTGNRMESIGGTINFDAVSGEGFKAELKFSVQ